MSAGESPEADEAAAEREERLVDLGAAVVTNEQPLELVQPGEGALDDPAVAAQCQSRARSGAARSPAPPGADGARAGTCRGRSHGRQSSARAAGAAGRPVRAPAAHDRSAGSAG